MMRGLLRFLGCCSESEEGKRKNEVLASMRLEPINATGGCTTLLNMSIDCLQKDMNKNMSLGMQTYKHMVVIIVLVFE